MGDSPLAGESGGVWRYLTGRDALNSVRQETDAAGAVLAVRRFDPYGVPLVGDGGQPYGYSGESWDAGTELVYLRARDLRPALGAVHQPAIPGRGTCAGRARCRGTRMPGGNPLRFTDPTGRAWSDASEGAGIYGTGCWACAFALSLQRNHGPVEAVSAGISFLPGIGDAKGLIEVGTGVDLITGEELGACRFLGLIGASEVRFLPRVHEAAAAAGRVARLGLSRDHRGG